MILAADLHLHSRYSGGVSPAMTLPNIAAWALRKGIDLLGTGDCLQADWLREIEAATEEAEPGLRVLRPAVADSVRKMVPSRLWRRLRFVLSTEVCCAPSGTPELGGLHHLVYFPSLESVRRFREKLVPLGDLAEGRPRLALATRRLVELVAAEGGGCRIAPAHVFNPWYSSLGSVSGGRTLREVFGEDGVTRLLAVEMGLTSTPPMCRRASSLDRHALFCCSDAHSLENLGRECTLVEIEPGYEPLMNALADGTQARTRGLIKYPLVRTRYYLNRCGGCQRSFDARTCPVCGRPLAIGSRDRLEEIADRTDPSLPSGAPPCVQLLPLAELLGELMGASTESRGVREHYDRMLAALGDERRILNELSLDEIAGAGTLQVARAIVAQRMNPPALRRRGDVVPDRTSDQLDLGL